MKALDGAKTSEKSYVPSQADVLHIKYNTCMYIWTIFLEYMCLLLVLMSVRVSLGLINILLQMES